MKKAQTEILGLAIVVILVVIATVLVVRFGFKNTEDLRSDFVASEEASNMLNTFLRTTSSGCSGLTMTELLQDCAQSRGIVCDNNQDSCAFAQSAAESILSATIGAEKKKYEFYACGNFNVKEIKCLSTPLARAANPDVPVPCPSQRKLKIFPIPINSGTIYIKLEICN